MRDYIDKRVTSITWGPLSPNKQALSFRLVVSRSQQNNVLRRYSMMASVHNYCISYAIIIQIRHKNPLYLSTNHVEHYFLNVLRWKGLHLCLFCS